MHCRQSLQLPHAYLALLHDNQRHKKYLQITAQCDKNADFQTVAIFFTIVYNVCYCARRGASGALLPTIRYSRAECCRRLSAWEAGLCKERWYQGLVQRDTVHRVRVGTQQHYADWACATRLLWSSHLQRYRFGVDCQLHRTVFRPLRTARAVRFLLPCCSLPANCTTCRKCFAFRFRTKNNVQLVNNFLLIPFWFVFSMVPFVFCRFVCFLPRTDLLLIR